jgi:hypothetical protein
LLLVYVGYCCWLCCASGNTLYWLLLLVYEGPRTTHFTGYLIFTNLHLPPEDGYMLVIYNNIHVGQIPNILISGRENHAFEFNPTFQFRLWPFRRVNSPFVPRILKLISPRAFHSMRICLPDIEKTKGKMVIRPKRQKDKVATLVAKLERFLLW